MHRIKKASLIFFLIIVVNLLCFCSSHANEFNDQSDQYASSLCTNSGGYIYDWQLANMIKMWVADSGYANMIFVFNQCFAGGMMDDLTEKLSGDVALMGAARHNESSIGLSDTFVADNSTEDKGFSRPEDYYAKEVGEELSQTGNNAPTAKQIAQNAASQDLAREGGTYINGSARPATSSEHPQYTSVGNGDNIKIGKKSDGVSDVASKHAILFAGHSNGMRHWNDVDRAYKALKDKQGFSADNICVLSGAGPGGKRPDGSNIPAYVDGSGTKKDLFDAIKALKDKMNPNEQFIFWASDHGNRERTAKALDKAITDPIKQTVPPPPAITVTSDPNMWDLDDSFLQTIRTDPNNVPFVSLIIDKDDIICPLH